MQDATGFALGGIGVGVIAYGLFSNFVSGPELGQRTIDLVHEWPQICEAGITARAQPQERPRAAVPNINACRMLFGIYGSDGQAYCDMHGHHFDIGASGLLDSLGDISDALNAPQRIADEIRRDEMIADAPDRCSCAASQVLSDEATSFALYAASGRLITPPSIDNLQSELRAALSSAQCEFEG